MVMIIRSSVPLSEIKFHTDYHGVGHGWICYELFCLKRENRDSSVDIRVKRCPHDLICVPLSEITFHTDYHGVGHGWICYERFYVRKEKSVNNPWTSV